VTRRAWPVIVAVAFAAAWPAVAQQGGAVRFGISVSMFEEVNPADAVAAARSWVNQLGGATHAWGPAEPVILPDTAATLRAFAEGMDFAAMSSVDYLSIEKQLAADPFMAFEQHGSIEIEYVLLTRPDVTDVSQLAGRVIAAAAPTDAPAMSDAWLEVLLSDRGIAGGTVDRIRHVHKASQAILPLFFKQVDAAVVSRSAFTTARELNPQLDRALKVLVASPPLLRDLVVVRRSMSAADRERFLEPAVELTGPKLRESFLIMRMEQLRRWQPSYLERTRTLFERYLVAHRKQGGRS
jgi:phosphonate transport system substrate-binding protein